MKILFFASYPNLAIGYSRIANILSNYLAENDNKVYYIGISNFGVNICDRYIHKNIILIDELVASGRTMTETYKYLKNEKNVGNIYATSVALYKTAYKGDINIDYVLPSTVLIWPWGYDN